MDRYGNSERLYARGDVLKKHTTMLTHTTITPQNSHHRQSIRTCATSFSMSLRDMAHSAPQLQGRKGLKLLRWARLGPGPCCRGDWEFQGAGGDIMERAELAGRAIKKGCGLNCNTRLQHTSKIACCMQLAPNAQAASSHNK